MKKEKTYQRLLIIFLLTISFFVKGQNCSCISGKKDKVKGIETVGGLTNTEDYYSLLVQKIINFNDTTIAPKYRLFFHAASRVLLSDSILKTKGTMELKLLDNSTITLDNVDYQNNFLGYCCTIGFWVYVSEETIKILLINPILTITIKEIHLSSTFTPKRQKEQQKIYGCLLKRKSK